MEPIIRAMSLDDLGTGQVDVPVVRPDGRTVVVSLRPLTEGEVFAVRRGIAWPKPPVKDMTKSGPVYDYGDKGYLDALAEANRTLTYRVLLAMLPFAVDGDDDAARQATLQAKLGQYAYIQLTQAAARLNAIGEEEIAAAARSFRANGHGAAPGDAQPGSDAGAVGAPAAVGAG